MIEAAILSAILWFGLLTLRAAESVHWWLAGFDLAMMALAGAMVLRRRLQIALQPIGVLLALAAGWGLTQAWLRISVDPQRTLESALVWAINCAAFCIALAACRNEVVRRRFLHAQVLFGLALAVFCMIRLYTAGYLGPFVYKNQFAAYLESVMGIAIATALKDRRRFVPWILIAAAMFACAAASGSRAGAILCLAELIVLPAVACARGWITPRVLAKVAAVAIAGAAVLVMVTGWETVWRRLQEPNPYAVRADLLRSSLAMAHDRPLAGFGLGAWPSAYPAYALYDDGTYVNQAHNDWAQWTVEGGIPFLFLILAIVSFLTPPALRSIWGLGLLAVFVHAWVDYPFEQRPALSAFLFSMAGVLAAETRPAIASGATRRPGESSRASPQY